MNVSSVHKMDLNRALIQNEDHFSKRLPAIQAYHLMLVALVTWHSVLDT